MNPFFSRLLYCGVFLTATLSPAAAQTDGTILIVVNANLYNGAISSEVLRLKADLEAENHTAKIMQWPSSGTSSLDLWNHLKSEYTNPSQSLKGAILIGSIPKPEVGGIYNELLYWNMDEFQTTNSVIKRHIWVSRINADDTTYGTEATLIKRALDANHYYRTGQSRLPFTAYRYKIPGWWSTTTYNNDLARVWPTVEQRGTNLYNMRFMPERDDVGDIAGADCMVKGGELFEVESHGSALGYMYINQVDNDYEFKKHRLHQNLVQARVCLIGACDTGAYGGIANEHLFTRGGGNVLTISNSVQSNPGETVIGNRPAFLDLLAAGKSWGDALVENWAIAGDSYTTLFGDLSIRPKASVSANAMPVINSWSPGSGVYTAPFNATFNANCTSAAGISKVEYFPDGYNYGKNDPTGKNDPISFNSPQPYNRTYPAGTYTVRIEVVDAYKARTWRESTFTVVAPPASYRTPENPVGTVPGVLAKYYQGDWPALPNFDSLVPVATDGRPNFLITPRNAENQVGFKFTGYIEVPTQGVYIFYTNSDDGSALRIGSTLVVNNDGLHGMEEKSGQIALKAGKHAISVTYFNGFGGNGLSVSWQGPGFGKEPIPDAKLSRFNVAPVARALNTSMLPGATKAITLRASDADNNPLTYTIVTQPTKGSLTGTGANRVYTPNAGYTGVDTFTFKVNDGALDSSTETVSITVSASAPINPIVPTSAPPYGSDWNYASWPGGGWSDGQAPSINKEYSTANFTLYTPLDAKGTTIFNGQSLLIPTGGGLHLKQYFGATVSANLILAGGNISNMMSSERYLSGTIEVRSASQIRVEAANRQILLKNNELSGSGEVSVFGVNNNSGLILESTTTSTHTGDWSVKDAQLVVSRDDQIGDLAQVTLSTATSYLDITSAQRIGALSGSGKVRAGASGAYALSVGGRNSSTTFSGAIVNELGTLSLVKEGTGTLTLSGVSSYTGATQVTGGTLVIDGVNTATIGALTVASGARLAGNGSTPAAVTLQTGGKMLANISNWTGAAGTGFTDLQVGSLAISGAWVLDITSLTAYANFSEASKTFPILKTTGGITGFNPANVTVVAQNNFLGMGVWSVAQNGNSLELIYTYTVTVGYSTRSDGYTLATFPVGTCEWMIPNGVTSVEVLVVGGGGSGAAGGTWNADGGGGGGVAYVSNYGVTGGSVVSVTAGQGGTPRTAYGAGSAGSPSSFDALSIQGGEGGLSQRGGNSGGLNLNGIITAGGLGATHAGSNGGGGAGQNGTGNYGACPGGYGYQSGITGTPTYYAGGGGGGYGGQGGLGGGGRGGYLAGGAGEAGVNGLGGGGGASQANVNSGAGGHGVVIVAYTVAANFAVSYNANGATSGTAPAAQTKIQNVALTLATNSGNLARTGHTFVGWNTAADGSGTDYAQGASYTANAVLTLYAKWVLNGPVVATGSQSLGADWNQASWTGGAWSDGLAPSAGKDYRTANFTVRSPNTSTTTTFNGRSLLIETSGGLYLKHKIGAVATANLILSGGAINNAEDNAVQGLSGTIEVRSASAIRMESANRQILLKNNALSGSGQVSVVGVNNNNALSLESTTTSTHTGDWTVQDARLLVSREDQISDLAQVTLSTSSSYLDIASAQRIGALSGSGQVRAGAAGTYALSVGGRNTSTTFSGAIVNELGTLSLVKEGTGTLTLSGVNSYTGATQVTGGTLVIDGANTATTGALTVASGARLGGNGSTPAAVTVQAGGKLLAGISDWTGAAGTGFTDLQVGSLTLSGNWTLDVSSIANYANFSEGNKTFTILSAPGGITGFNSANVTVVANSFVGTGTWSVAKKGNALELVYAIAGSSVASYVTWDHAYPAVDLSDTNADFDGDGISNFNEFAFGLDPTSGASSNPIKVPLDKTTNKFRYTRRVNTALIYRVETSTFLQSWATSLDVRQSVVSTANGVETVEVELLTQSPGSALFVRVSAQ